MDIMNEDLIRKIIRRKLEKFEELRSVDTDTAYERSIYFKGSLDGQLDVLYEILDYIRYNKDNK